MARPRTLLLPLGLLTAVIGGEDAGSEGTCASGSCGEAGKGGAQEEDWWPSSAGRKGQYSHIPYEQPWDLPKTLAWKADYPVTADKQSHSVTLGTTIDRDLNVYVSSHDGIVKHDKDGKQLWKYSRPPPFSVPTNPGLYKGQLYGSTHQGYFFSLDMKTGKELWRTKVAVAICGDTGSVTAHDGVVVGGAEPIWGDFDGCSKMAAVNASSGEFLWQFYPDNPIWNVMAQYPDDGTVVFQDLTGRVYRLNLGDGSLVWKNGGFPDSWTDGTQILYEGVVYAVNLQACGGPDCHGDVSAYRLEDGKQLWKTEVPRPPNAFPAVGRLREGAGLSVVIPIGQQPSCETGFMSIPGWRHLPFSLMLLVHRLSLWLGDSSRFLWLNWVLPTDLMALDAATGKVQWSWKGPTWLRKQTPGDEEDWYPRVLANTRAACCPNTWGGPKIAADGTIYVGNQAGDFLAIKDKNGNGRIEDETEVMRYDTGAAFSGPGSAHAPGMVAVASCDTVFVFKK